MIRSDQPVVPRVTMARMCTTGLRHTSFRCKATVTRSAGTWAWRKSLLSQNMQGVFLALRNLTKPAPRHGCESRSGPRLCPCLEAWHADKLRDTKWALPPTGRCDCRGAVALQNAKGLCLPPTSVRHPGPRLRFGAKRPPRPETHATGWSRTLHISRRPQHRRCALRPVRTRRPVVRPPDMWHSPKRRTVAQAAVAAAPLPMLKSGAVAGPTR
jgi:hypothetical protein